MSYLGIINVPSLGSISGVRQETVAYQAILEDAGFSDIDDVISTIGVTEVTLTIPSGTVDITADTTIPANVHLKPLPGAMFSVSTGKTLTVNGHIEAGPHQIFTGAGKCFIGNSPTVNIPIEWYGGLSGINNNIATALAKIDPGNFTGIAIGKHQNIVFGPGIYRIATATTLRGIDPGNAWPVGYGLIGNDTYLMIDTTGAVGLTMGASGQNAVDGWRMKGIYIVGDASCCTYALKVYEAVNSEFDLSLYVGATQWAAFFAGVNKNKFSFNISPHAGSIPTITPDIAANCVQFTADGGGNSNTWNKIRFMSGNGIAQDGYGLYLNQVGDNWDITGNFEMFDYGVVFDTCEGKIFFHNFHIEENQICEYIVKACSQVVFESGNSTPHDDTTVGKFIATTGLSLRNFQSWGGTIYPGCSGIIENCITAASGALGLNDLTNGGMQYVGFPSVWAAGETAGTSRGDNSLNFLNNSLLDRWGTNFPDLDGTKATNQTWTKATSGVGGAPTGPTTNFAKIVTSAQDSSWLNLPTSLYNKTVSISCQINLPSGQAFSSNAFILGIGSTPPAWANATAYYEGDAVAAGGVYMAVCVIPGTSGGSEPTWNPGATYTIGMEFTDGGVTWVLMSTYSESFYNCPTLTANVSDVNWRQAWATTFIPRNASQAQYYVLTNPKTGPANGTVYMALPGLRIGTQPFLGVKPGKDEHESYIKVGNKKLWSTTPAGGTWIEVGDVDLSSGQRCTVAGAQGAGATWANFP